MLRVLLLSLALCHAVFALPNAFETEDDFEREIEELLQALVKEEDRADNGLDEMDRATGLTPLSIVGMPTEQSSMLDSRFPSGNAVDGNLDTNLNKPGSSCTHSKPEYFPWWKVDLQEEHCIGKITLLNRGDCCSERLTNAIVRAGTKEYFPSNGQCGAAVTSAQAGKRGGTITLVCNPPLRARYISVSISSDDLALLQLCEVTVEEYSLGECHSQDIPLSIVGSPTEQSTTYGARYPSGNAVDGNHDTNLNKEGSSCTHTNEENNPWWTVDLGWEHCISTVTILNRGDCCSERLTNAIVRVGNRVCGSPVTAKQAQVLGGNIVVECDPPLMGDSIQVEIPGTSYLQLCEVTVEELIPHDQCPSMDNELSIVGNPTEQSTMLDSRFPSGNAVDGNRDTNLNKAGSSCTHSKEENNPWWRVDLGGARCISKVTILNRGDCCSDRLTGAVVRAGTSTGYISNNAICGSPVTAGQASTLGGTIEIICDPPLRASYVSVDIPSSGAILQLCEVAVEEMLPGYC